MATIDEETQHLLQLYKGEVHPIMSTLHTQFGILANRSQTLLQLAGITITVTGFSGANIARSGRTAAMLLCSGLAIVLLAAVFALIGILRVEWITNTAPLALEDAVRLALSRRQTKTRAYVVAMAMLVIGLALYVSSISLLLLGNMPP